jgi:hypothetical protein
LPSPLFFDTSLLLKETSLLPVKNNVLLQEAIILPEEIILPLREDNKPPVKEFSNPVVFSLIP